MFNGTGIPDRDRIRNTKIHQLYAVMGILYNVFNLCQPFKIYTGCRAFDVQFDGQIRSTYLSFWGQDIDQLKTVFSARHFLFHNAIPKPR